MKVPFISITDFTSYLQVQKMLLIAKKHNRTRSAEGIRKLGVGVMMSHKTLHGIPTKWAAVFPEKEKIANIFLDHSLAFNVIHYADYQGIDVLASLIEVAKWGGGNLNALQLDMTWPDPSVVIKFREIFPNIQIVLQIGAKAFEVIENNPSRLVWQLEVYKNAIDYVLLDRSMGKGKTLNANDLLYFLDVISAKLPDLGLVVAGGLGPTTLGLLDPIIEKYPWVSTDAQGKLRPSGSNIDPIDWDFAKEYLEKSFVKFSKK